MNQLHHFDALTPYTRTTGLADFLPAPRYLFAMDLSPTAMILYIHLLDRAVLSQKNQWWNEKGWVYLIFTVPDLARALRKTRSTIQKRLVELEEAGLIVRSHPTAGGATNYFLRVPATSAVDREAPFFSTPPEKFGQASEMSRGWVNFQWGRHQKSGPNKPRE